MTTFSINIVVQKLQLDELTSADRKLVDEAKAMTGKSYAPYSRFNVGAALLMSDGSVYGGANQENAAFPVGTCAERSAFFYATAAKPDVAPVAIAIAARTAGRFTDMPVSPCGMCRQALLEAETRFGTPIRVLLYGEAGVYVVSSIRDLLPLTFDGSELEG